MAKLTAEEISNFKIIRATFEEGKWVILVSDDNNFIYRVSFEGSESDDNNILLTNTHSALLDIEKKEPVMIKTPTTREDLNGLNPVK